MHILHVQNIYMDMHACAGVSLPMATGVDLQCQGHAFQELKWPDVYLPWVRSMWSLWSHTRKEE